ncbi:hypothetical protein AXF42_Ash018669 [Apostasia shenzhenica]|uniref:Uncharacterized protein n=1 Tax=Apostasia shenzhenica TaxID=1088818 RepID=A0A2H9ZZN6_9ASPA|nr:hypothetical protein AXF42_Ash018669 [Apostasia shenzhenica]
MLAIENSPSQSRAWLDPQKGVPSDDWLMQFSLPSDSVSGYLPSAFILLCFLHYHTQESISGHAWNTSVIRIRHLHASSDSLMLKNKENAVLSLEKENNKPFGYYRQTDLCHQPNDDDEEDDDLSICESFLEKANAPPSRLHIHGRCFPFGKVRLGSRQKYVILVIVLTFAFMVAMAILIYVGRRKNPIESSLVAKVASLAAVSLVCFTSSSALALATNCPILSYEHLDYFDSINCSASEFFYYIVGFSVPSSYVLWSMREMPPGFAADLPPQTREVIIIRDNPPAPPIPQWRTTVTNSQNKKETDKEQDTFDDDDDDDGYYNENGNPGDQ